MNTVDGPPNESLPSPIIRNHRWVPRLVWLGPIVAALVGILLLFSNWRDSGPRITISFLSGEGVQVGKTQVKYRDVVVGQVTAVALTSDNETVVVTAELSKNAEKLVYADTQMWVVRPRVDVGSISGLDTLLSGPYIAIKKGSSTVVEKSFKGLEKPPSLSHGPRGREVALRAAHAGSLTIGAPVYFRQFQVGQIIDENLLADGSTRVVVFVETPYDQFIKPDTRFWNASGVNLSLGANGLDIKTESMATVLAGGIAFDDGPANLLSAAIGKTREATLYKDEAEAQAPPDGQPSYIKMKFTQALRGLEVGAPVEFIGVNIGSVVGIDLGYEPDSRRFPVIVTAKLYPHRMGQAYESVTAKGQSESDESLAKSVSALVRQGLRAQPRSGSLLTGKLFIALDIQPTDGEVAFDSSLRPLEIPTINGTSEELERNVARFVKTLSNLPLATLAADLDRSLDDLHGSLGQLNGQVLPRAADNLSALHPLIASAGQMFKEDSTLQRGLIETLTDTQNTMSAIRELASYLDRHPEALIRGRRAQKVPRNEPDRSEGSQ